MAPQINLRTEISPEELAEAMKLNRTRMYWPKVFLANWYATLLLIVVLWADLARLAEHKPLQPAGAGLLLIPAFLLWLYWYRTQGAVRKGALDLSDTQGTATMDASGISARASSGATSFIPWGEYSGWDEGVNVFTLTKGKSFRVLSKRGLSNAELEQMRSLFRSQIS